MGVREQAEPDHVSLPLHWPPQSDRLRSSKKVFGLKLLKVTLNTLALLKTEYLENKLIILKKGQACVKGPLEGEIHSFDLID